MIQVPIRRHDLTLLPDSERVILRPFIPSSTLRLTTIIGRALALTEQETAEELTTILGSFESRHRDLHGPLMDQFERVAPQVFTQRPLSPSRKLLIGALFSGEYSLESAALFNPSLVAHPDQSGMEDGALRFVMSLRATGEGHVSSIEFRTGHLTAQGEMVLDPHSRFATAPKIEPNPNYEKISFHSKLHELGFDNDHATRVLQPLGEGFTRSDLNRSVLQVKRETKPIKDDLRNTLNCIQWLADSNYELHFSPDLALSERVIFPASPNETNGIEDARFVRFVENDGSVRYYATYTAYNGHAILPQLIQTKDFLHFQVLTLNGSAVQNKGMALFPRRIDGNFLMLSRQDDENLFLMISDNPHFWNESSLLLRPIEMWESVKVGNCGSPIETEAGWLVITHGVGPLRRYCISAVLLDLHDPSKVLGRLREPLLEPDGPGREGYVPNVVYSCGSLVHGPDLFLPFAMSDQITTIASMPLADLLAALLASPPQ